MFRCKKGTTSQQLNFTGDVHAMGFIFKTDEIHGHELVSRNKLSVDQ